MNASIPFAITPAALEAIESLLQRHPEMHATLVLFHGFEETDEQGMEARFDDDHFMMGYDTEERFPTSPRFELFGRPISVAPDALEKLRGNTLALETRHVIHATGAKEPREFLVIA